MGMSDCKPVKIPMDPDNDLIKVIEEKALDQQSLVEVRCIYPHVQGQTLHMLCEGSEGNPTKLTE